MTLITRNLEQIRRVASQNSKNLKEQNSKTDFTNITDTMKIDIASMKKSKLYKETKNFLNPEVAEDELDMTLTHYQMFRMKERTLRFIAKITQETPTAFTLRTTAEYISDFANEFKIVHNIKK